MTDANQPTSDTTIDFSTKLRQRGFCDFFTGMAEEPEIQLMLLRRGLEGHINEDGSVSIRGPIANILPILLPPSLIKTKKGFTINETIGKRIRFRRRQLGWSQRDLSEKLGLSFQQVHKYEVGKIAISVQRLHQIATILNIPHAYFFDGI